MDWPSHLKAWAQAGIAPSEFWVSTPREAQIVLSGAIDRQRQDLRMAQGIAYVQAVLVRAAKMPRFDQVFPDARTTKRAMSPAETMAIMKGLTAGTTVRG